MKPKPQGTLGFRITAVLRRILPGQRRAAGDNYVLYHQIRERLEHVDARLKELEEMVGQL